MLFFVFFFFFFSSRRRHTRCGRDWSSDVCSSDLLRQRGRGPDAVPGVRRGVRNLLQGPRRQVYGAAGGHSPPHLRKRRFIAALDILIAGGAGAPVRSESSCSRLHSGSCAPAATSLSSLAT